MWKIQNVYNDPQKLDVYKRLSIEFVLGMQKQEISRF
jgi:hypothetical protein